MRLTIWVGAMGPLLLNVALAAASKSPSKDAILLSNITCSGGTAQGLFEPEVVRCTNQGSDYDPESIQWTCTASLPPEFKFGSTNVICEGYRNSDDDWVLKGSCGVEYRLELTDLGEEKWPERVSGSWNMPWSAKGDLGGADSESKIPALLFWCVFIGIAGWIVWAAFIRDSDWGTGAGRRRPLGGGGNRRPPGGGGGGGGGGGWWPGGGDDDPPPPPYSRYDRPDKPSTSNRSQGGQGWQPGFWTGAAGGAAATYLANSLSGRNSRTTENGRGPGGAFNRGYDAGVGPSNTRGPSGPSGGFSSSPGYSSSRYESSGFGGTSRR